MKFGLDDDVLQKIRVVFSMHPGIQRVVMYGSRALGTFKVGSDIDLTIIDSAVDLSTLLKIENQLDDLLLPYKIDLSIFEKIENENLKSHIRRVGVNFYRRD